MTRSPDAPALLRRLERRLGGPEGVLLEAVRAAAAAEGVAIWLVGGALRDLLRGTPSGRRRGSTELDLAVEGAAGTIAKTVAAALGAEVVQHDRFGTARLRLSGATVDLARTRRERYPQAGALPEVARASIEVDLGRRDFSVNAMALGLNGARRGEFLDLHGGRRDLERGLIRVLHERSFRDDPTRLIRACRYAARIEGRLAPGTGAQARASLRYLPALSGERFGEAWRRLLTDAEAGGALRRAMALGMPGARVPGWTIPEPVRAAFAVLREESAQDGSADALFWALNGLALAAEVSARLPGACGLTRAERGLLEDGAALREKRSALGRASLRDSAAAALLRPHNALALRAAARLWRGWAGDRVAEMPRWRQAASPIDAEALSALGVPGGRETGAWLRRLRDAAIDGELPTGRGGRRAAERLVRRGLAT